MAAGSPKQSSPTQSAFHRLLGWLDEGIDSGGEKYLEMRRRLVQYFDRKNCLCPDELADETLNRVARRLEEEGGITDTPPARYCYILARFVFLEYQRAPENRQVSLELQPQLDRSPDLAQSEAAIDRTKRLDCLDGCLEELKPEDQSIILEYYRGERRVKIQRRRDLAGKLGITPNALSIRACRIRNHLEECVTCCDKHDTSSQVSAYPEEG
jgi:DNA-directed RNA polymerase specialized sigma24 family protein